MSNEIVKTEDASPPSQVREAAVTVSITVAAHGKPEDAEGLAQAVLKAIKILVPNVTVG